jgi:glycosyltransferase involved in cell wall biosynthesis
MRFDVIHVVTNSSIIPGSFLKVFYGLPFVSSLIGIPTEPLLRHAEPSVSARFKYYLNQVFLSLLLRISDVVVVPSNFAKKFFLNFYGKYLDDKVSILPRCVNTDEFYPKRQTKRNLRHLNLLHVGALSYRKGIEILLKAIPEVLEVFPQTALKVVGPGSIHKLSKLAEELHIRSHVHFTGTIPHDRVPELLHAADVFILPSRRLGEVFPNAVLEALASETPVIATRVGTLHELIEHGVTGLLVEPENPSELAQAIVSLASDTKILKYMGKNGRESVLKKYSLEFLGIELEKIYRRLN